MLKKSLLIVVLRNNILYGIIAVSVSIRKISKRE